MSDQGQELEQDNTNLSREVASSVLEAQKQSDGSVIFLGPDRKPVFGFEKGELGVVLPSGKKINIFSDSRISGQAAYSPTVKGLVFTPATVNELKNPNVYYQEGWQTPEQRAVYFLKHEYTHLAWDQIGETIRKQIIDVFMRPEVAKAMRWFAATLVSKLEYQKQEETDLSVDCIELFFGGKIHRYSKELIVNELLAHAAVGEIMDRAGVTQVQRHNAERENFGLRSKAAIDCLETIGQRFPKEYALLKQKGLMGNDSFAKDLPVIRAKAVSLAT